MESSTKSDKIRDIVKLKLMLKKWRNQANNNNSSSNSENSTTNDSNNATKKKSMSRSNSGEKNEAKKKGTLSRSNSMKGGISFLKRTLSFTDLSSTPQGGVSSNNAVVPKGFLAVHVGEDMKRFVIPTNYLKHQAFCVLLKEAEDEFGFQQEGILRIPCEVEVFEDILSRVDTKKAIKLSRNDGIVCGSTESQSLSTTHHPSSPMCR